MSSRGRRKRWHAAPLRSCLDSWTGIGHVAVGMHRQGYDLQLTQCDERGWRATSYTTGTEHSPRSAKGLVVQAHARVELGRLFAELECLGGRRAQNDTPQRALLGNSITFA